MTGHILQTLNQQERQLGPFGRGALTDTGLSPWQHWRLRTDEQGIAWLVFDRADASSNSLSQAVLEELGQILDQLLLNKPRALVLRSAKESHFCVGADLREFRNLDTTEAVEQKLLSAHAVADRLASADFPTLAVIHGHCFGGGLELALCCQYRLAVHGARLGFPEIQLGLHPGLGGTARATQLIDPIAAMTMMLTGKPVSATKARKLGLVDAVLPERHLAAAIESALNGRLPQQRPNLRARILNSAPARQLAARKMREQAAEKAMPAHYPAPEALIDLWEKHGSDSHAMRRAEVSSFARLLTGETAQNLIRVFFLREAMKNIAKEQPTFQFNRVHVVGAGAMGGDIAGWCAMQGMTVTLSDQTAESIARAVRNTAILCERKHLGPAEKRRVLDRLIPDLHNLGVRTADVVIEAVPEDLAIKHQVYREIEPQLKPGAILATNTSSIPLDQLRQGLQHPDRLVGLHFFNPVARMQLVEVVSQRGATEEVYQKALAFTGKIGRLPAPVLSAPGFLVNRALTPYLLEAVLMLDEGMAPETIDRAAEAFGMPVGPLELADRVGLDICLGAADMLREQLTTTELAPVPAWLRQKVDDGNLGRKTGEGIYLWQDGKPQKKKEVPEAPEGTVNRLILPMINACMTCLRLGIVPDEDILDGAMIFGAGFAPFRGGPLHYARKNGFAEIAIRLDVLEQQYGARFRPDPGWRKDPDELKGQ
ncbi:MAG: 3-hydroxyacyl-CoA dehydrogenase NAD-binding domain-containing protein [Cellvibrio sp.]